MATITGTSSAETLANNAGVSDTITGLAGHDTFVYTRSGAHETDVLTDFGSTYFAATLNGSQEVPPSGSSASGELIASLARGNAAFNFSVSATGLDFNHSTATTADDAVAAHFHAGAAGANGGVVFGFLGLSNDTDGDTQMSAVGGTTTFTGQWDASEGQSTTLTAQLANLMAGNIYVDFHTVARPGGEIRGQVAKQDSGLDKLDVTAANIGSFATMQLLLEDVSGSAQFSTQFDGHSHTMKFQSVSEASLSGADFIFAGSVRDHIVGTDRADDLFGAGSKDRLEGGKGADRLFGESGADTLTGGKGQDLLYGGSADDTFTFARLSDTSNVPGTRDIIVDFNQAQGDRIDLHKIDADTTLTGNQAFFLGAGPTFSGTPGELLQFSSGGTTVILGNIDGDTNYDFQIELRGTFALVNADFNF